MSNTKMTDKQKVKTMADSDYVFGNFGGKVGQMSILDFICHIKYDSPDSPDLSALLRKVDANTTRISSVEDKNEEQDTRIDENKGKIESVESTANDAKSAAETAQTTADAIKSELESKVIYDVSSHNDGAVFESIQALLSSSNLDTLIPTSVRCGGMSIRFIQGSAQSSDNKYVQYFLTKDDWSTTESDWKKMNLEDELNHINTLVNGNTTIEEVTITADQAGFIALSNGAITNPSGDWKHTILVPIDSFVSATGFINNASVAGIALYSSDSFDSYLGGFTRLNTGVVITDLSPYISQYPTARYVAFTTDTSKVTFVCKYNNTVAVNGLKNRVELLEGGISIINEDVNGLKSKVSSLRKISASNKMLHISFDDTINAFKDLIDNNRASLFDSPFFGALKTLHDTYGCAFSCYCFYDMIDLKYVSQITTISSPSTTSVYYLSKTDESYSAGLYVYKNSTWTAYDNSTMRDNYVLFSLSDMTNTYSGELSNNSDWLKFGFHWIDGLEGLSGITRTSAEVKTAYDNTILDIVRITGTVKSIDMVPRLQGFGGSIDICRALRDCDCGCLGFLTSDYSETRGGQGGQSQGYYLTTPAPVVLWNKGQWYDYQERLHFYPSSLRLDGQTATATETYMNKFLSVSKWGQAQMICMYCHENQMFVKGRIASNYIAALTKVAEWAVEHGYLFGYPMDRIRASF